VWSRTGVSIANISFPAPISVPQGVAAYGDLVYIVEAMDGNLTVFQNNILLNSSLVGAGAGVAVDDSGNVYVAVGTTIKIFSPSLTLLETLYNNMLIDDLAVGADGRIFAVNYLDDNVSIYGSNHQFVGYLGEPGTGPGQFDNPHGIAVDKQGYIFVSDIDLDRIQIFSPDLQLVGTINGILGAYGVEVDDTGRLYVVSSLHYNVTVWETMDLGDHDGPSVFITTLLYGRLWILETMTVQVYPISE
jgi:DNA-binding beta-propeller fold protein YncE